MPDKKSPNFNQRTFGAMFAKRFGLTQADGMRFFNEIGKEIADTLNNGGLVKVFGAATIKLEKRRGVKQGLRMRCKPSSAINVSAPNGDDEKESFE